MKLKFLDTGWIGLENMKLKLVYTGRIRKDETIVSIHTEDQKT